MNSPVSPVASGVAEIAVRLADEGIPVRAIARATKVSSEDIRDVLHTALDQGLIVQLPRDDWPVGVARDRHIPDALSAKPVETERMIFNIVRLFKVTKLQAALFSVLIKRNEVTKETLHQVAEQRRLPNKEETDPKIVDVVICNLRKKLKPFDLEIKTAWACGYYMEPLDRARANSLLKTYMESLSEPVEIEKAYITRDEAEVLWPAEIEVDE